MSISIIAAVAKNNVIGIKNELPWNIPEDLERFKRITLGKTVLMGQNTFDSILKRHGKPLPGRKNVVVSFDPNHKVPQGVLLYNDLDKALAELKDEDVFICGGASIYKQTINLAGTLYITHIEKEYEGDAFFPEIDLNRWQEAEEEKHNDFSFVTYIRK